MSEYHYLPGILREIADVAGLRAALAIGHERGGTRVHFPAHAGDAHWLTRLVGREAADAICAHFRGKETSGMELLVPLGPKNFYARARRLAAEMTAKGMTRERVAAELGIHMRSVQRYRARMRDEEPRLF